MTRRAALALALALAALACGRGSREAAAPPRLAMPASFDFGPVRAETSLTRRIRLRNSGGQTLQILDVSSSCDCLVGKPDRSAVAPGMAVDLNITLRVSERSGPLRRTVTVRTNDPGQPEQTLELTATVVKG